MSAAMQALYEGDAERARQLLPADDVLTVFEAAAFGRDDRLRELLAADPPAARRLSDDGFTALHLAIYGGQEEAARMLIRNGADVNARSVGSIAEVAPLGTAAFVGSVPFARLLLDAGAEVDGRGGGGFTALHAAAQNGDVELVRELLAHGADRAAASDTGKTPADLATDPRVQALLE